LQPVNLPRQWLFTAVTSAIQTDAAETAGDSPVHLLPLQQAMLAALVAHPHAGWDIEQVVWEFSNDIDPDQLIAAWNEVATACSALRLSPQADRDGEFRVLRKRSVPVDLERACTITAAELPGWLARDRRRGFTIDGERTLWRISALGTRMVVATIHHVVLDDRSLKRVVTAITRRLLGHASPLMPDNETWLQTCGRHARIASQPPDAAWWRQRWDSAPVIEDFPADPALLPTSGPQLARTTQIMLTAAETAELGACALAHGCSTAVMVHAAWVVMLTAWQRSDDVTYAHVRAGRHHQGQPVGDHIGMLMNTLVRRLRTRPQTTVSRLLAELAELQLSERPHALASLAQVAKVLNMPVKSFVPATVLAIDHEDPLAEACRVAGQACRISLFERPPFLLAARVALGPQLSCVLQDGTHHFSEGALDRLAQQFRHLLLTIMRQPTSTLAELPVLDPEQERRLVVAYNATQMRMPLGLGLHQPFESRAASAPACPALWDGDRCLSYGELEAAANRLAHHLRALGAKPDTLVAVRLARSADQAIALLAVLKTGAAFVPLDLQWPLDRVAWILDQAHAVAMVTTASFSIEGATHVYLDRDAVLIAARPATSLETVIDETKPAYLIFTSGSTWRPKGVVIDHRGALNTIFDLNARLSVTAADRVLGISSYTFDLSIYDLFGLLAAGGALVICPQSDTRDPQAWSRLIERHQITVWNSVPALAEMLIEGYDAAAPALASIRLVMMSGDWIPLTLPSKLKLVMPQTEQLSLGGATEASIWSILHPIVGLNPGARSVPYGRPMANQEFHVLDRHLRPCPQLVQGDLYIGGVGLAHGYWADPERTAASFIHTRDGRRLYRTGDQGRFLPTGEIEFLGRNDTQVKLNGFRIELGEIESVARECPGVAEACAIIREDVPGIRQLVLYVVGPQAGVDPVAVEALCWKRLPGYMQPHGILPLEAFPLSANGKVDRAALPRPDQKTAAPMQFSPMEERLAVVWQQLIGQRPPSAISSFFTSGGDSLNAVRLVRLLQREFGVTLPITQIFEHPSLAAMADLLTSGAQAPTADKQIIPRVLPLQPHGNRAPAYLIGEYFDIGRAMVLEQPLHGLFLGAGIRIRERQLSFSDIAKLCLTAIRREQPLGPLHLAGHCFGAIIAFEIACLEQEAGRPVARLIMLDPPAPAGIEPPPIPFGHRWRYHAQRMWSLGPIAGVDHAFNAVRNSYRQWQERRQGIEESRIFADFTPRRLAIPVHLILAEEGYLRSIPAGDPRLAWARWCDRLHVEESAGDHVTFCRAPQVEGLAKRLSELLKTQ
jgi:amino acid adenylation domain-containing protein